MEEKKQTSKEVQTEDFLIFWKMNRKSLIEKMTSGQRCEGSEGASYAIILRKNALGKEKQGQKLEVQA